MPPRQSSPCSCCQLVIVWLQDPRLLCRVPVTRHLDRDGNGSISVEEVRQLLGELGVAGEAADGAHQLIQSAAADGAADVTFAQFLDFHKKVSFLKAWWLLNTVKTMRSSQPCALLVQRGRQTRRNVAEMCA